MDEVDSKKEENKQLTSFVSNLIAFKVHYK